MCDGANVMQYISKIIWCYRCCGCSQGCGRPSMRYAAGLLVMGALCLGDLSSDGVRLCQHACAQERTPVVDPQLILGAERLSDAFRAVAKHLKPSVVTITSSVEVPTDRLRGGGIDDFRLSPRSERLFPEDPLDEPRPRRRLAPRQDSNEQEQAKTKVQTGMGSGVIVSVDGYVLTNNHVIADADLMQVELSDGRVLSAKVIGSDTLSDVAVLKIDATGLTPAVLGDSAKMEAGDWVLAIGSPFGLDQTVTAGIISATHRQTGIIQGGYEDFLQTDASINPGNSGGPLVSLRGEVIGINTAISSETGANAGVGFAIPVNMARRIMDDLRREGRVVRGFMGAKLSEVTMQNAAELQLPPGILRGALIATVSEGQPAARANLQANDVVVAINDMPITSSAQLRNTVAMTRPGSPLVLDIYRNGKKLQLTVEVGELTPEKLAAITTRTKIPELGIEVDQLSRPIAEVLGVDPDTQGAIVIKVINNQALQLRMQAGDIIVRVDDTDIKSPQELKTMLAELQQFTLHVQRQNQLIRIRVIRQ